ncbi:MAG: hypothetical protein H0X37_22280, partial [Herpetosiphonaceae bacterium]|nr:hypothetical protein [Herpetosiphonaceae bacterium]
TWPLLWLAILLWPLDIAVRRLLLPPPNGLRAWLAHRRQRSPALANERVRLRATLQRKPGDPSQPQTTSVPSPPARTNTPNSTPQFDWRSTRRSRVERPPDRDQQ